jgi:hypothetical protein
MEKRRTLYTQPTIEASTKLHHEKSLAASWFMRTHDLSFEPLQLKRIGRPDAINMVLIQRAVESTNLHDIQSTISTTDHIDEIHRGALRLVARLDRFEIDRSSLRTPFDSRHRLFSDIHVACHVFDPEAEPQAQTRRERAENRSIERFHRESNGGPNGI